MRHLTDYRALLVITIAAMASMALVQEQGPSLRILSPEEGATVQGSNLELKMQVRGVALSPSRSSNSAYVLLRLDDAPPLKAYSDTFTFRDVASGNHVVRAELRRADGSAFQPPLRTQVRFVLRAEQD